MPEITAIVTLLHTLSAVVWVGGMFFAYVMVRPSLGFLEPPQRLKVWNNIFARFFPVVWVAVIILPVTGYHQVYADFGDFSQAGMHVTVMHMIALVMIGLFAFMYAYPYRLFKYAVAAEEWKPAANYLGTIRTVVGINTVLGLLTVAVGSSGRFWG